MGKFIANLTLDDYIEAVELAMSRGKQPGESILKEIEEIAKKKNKKLITGNTDKDIDLLTGDLREKGFKVLNIKEIERRNKNEN